MRIEYMKIYVDNQCESEDEFWRQHRHEPLDIRSIDGRSVRFNDMGFGIRCDICGELIFEDEGWELIDGEDRSMMDHAGELPDNPSGYRHSGPVGETGEDHPCEIKLEQMRKEAKE